MRTLVPMGKKPAPRTVTFHLDKPIKLIVEDPAGGRAEVQGTATYAGEIGCEQVLIVVGEVRAIKARA